MAKERTFSLAQDRQNKEIGEVNRDNQRLQEQLDKLDHELSVVNAAIKDVEDDSEVIKNLNEEFTTPSNKGIFDKNQEKLTSRYREIHLVLFYFIESWNSTQLLVGFSRRPRKQSQRFPNQKSKRRKESWRKLHSGSS